MSNQSTWIIGWDLGQARDYTALAVAEKVWDRSGERPVARYDVRHLERHRGVAYTAIGARVQALRAAPPLSGAALLAVDYTGVGRPVVDQLRALGLNPLAVSIHGGINTSVDVEARAAGVPKRDLVAGVQVLLQGRLLRVAEALELVPVLTKELETFRVTIDPATAHDSYSAWREADHDDLVLAVALAMWAGEHAHALGLAPLPRPRPRVAAARGWSVPGGLGRDRAVDHEVSINGGTWQPARCRLPRDFPYGR